MRLCSKMLDSGPAPKMSPRRCLMMQVCVCVFEATGIRCAFPKAMYSWQCSLKQFYSQGLRGFRSCPKDVSKAMLMRALCVAFRSS